MSTTKTFNMIVLGAYLKVKPIVELKNVIAGLKKSLPQRHHHLLDVNEEAIKRGLKIVKQVKVPAH
jgi:2-oxoglutarate ferredoxin oxidoreductase subunit gamma